MRRLAPTSLCLAALLLAGCSTLKFWSSGPSASVGVRSARTGATLMPRYTTAVYRNLDRNTADIYLTDLPAGRLSDASDTLDGASGSIVHINVFLNPKAGNTPIDPTACNAAVRQLILADGAKGLYAGGGFVLPAGIGKDSMEASVREATLRLGRATANFDDLLGPCTLSGSLTARHDDRLAGVLAARLADLTAGLAEVKTPAAK